MDLTKLLKPNSIAIVGASENVDSFGGGTSKNLLDYAKEQDVERIYFVNPKHESIMERPCYKSVSDIDGTIDLLVICTPQKTVLSILKEGAAKGVGGAVVFASGYGETGTPEGKQNEAELIATAKELGIAIMGPNCAGFVNFTDDKWPFAFISEKRDRKGSVGIVSQSGQLCLSMMDNPAMRFSYTISAGNAKCVTIEDYLEFLVNDENTKVVGMYIEGIKDATRFAGVLKRANELHKPVVILKAGRSSKGGAIAASHTGSLSGSDKAFDAVLKKFHAIRVDDLEELIAMSMLLSTLPQLPKKGSFSAMCLSGGETGICADVGSLYGVHYPDFTEETLAALNEMLPSYATPNNPLDTTTTLSYDVDRYAKAVQTVIADPGVEMLVIGYTLLQEIADPAIVYMYEALKKVQEEGNTVPIAMLPFVENTRNREYQEKLFKIGIPVLPPPTYAFKMLKSLADYVEGLQEETTLELALPDQKIEKTRSLSEIESKRILADFGVDVPVSIIAKTEEEACEYWNEHQQKLVMKISSKDIMHKSDVGGVALSIEGEENVRETFRTVMNNCKTNCPDAVIDGILMTPMLEQGVEMIIGVNNDPQFGPMVMVGMGGVFVEIFKDVALYPAPLSPEEAKTMLKSLKAFPLLNGARGRAKCDVDAIANAISKIGDFAVANKNTVKELDINPMFVYEEGKGVGIADALIVMSE